MECTLRAGRVAVFLPLGGLAVTVALLALSGASAATLAGTEIDADVLSPGNALFSQTADDWAETGGSAAEGIFLLGTGGNPDFTGCYGSDLSVNPSINGTAGFICDGSSDSRFDGNGGDTVVEPEMNVVSPGGKQNADIWAIQAGSVTAKDDFSHAYSLFRNADSSCDADLDPDDRFLVLGGHRGDNEGDAFWGFEMNQVPPTRFGDLVSNGGGSFNLDFNRLPGDLLVSFTLTGGGTTPVLEVFSWNGTTFELLIPTLCPGGSQGDSLLRTNPANDIQAPPWNVPACDPTATNNANNCRVVNQNGTAPAPPGDNLLAPRDFNEAIVDLSAFVSGNVCFNSLLFTSRSAHPLETADLKDVGGANVNTCPPPPAPPPAAPPPAAPPIPGGPLPPIALPPTGAGPEKATSLWLATGALAAAAGIIVLTRSRRS